MPFFIAKMALKESPCEAERDCLHAHPAKVIKCMDIGLANDRITLYPGDHIFRRKGHSMRFVEMCVDPLRWKVVAIADNPRKLDREVGTLWYPRDMVRYDTDLWPCILRRRGRDKRERHTIDLSILWVEKALLVRHIAVPTQCPTNDLLTK